MGDYLEAMQCHAIARATAVDTAKGTYTSQQTADRTCRRAVLRVQSEKGLKPYRDTNVEQPSPQAMHYIPMGCSVALVAERFKSPQENVRVPDGHSCYRFYTRLPS